MNKHATVQDLATETRDLLRHCGVAEAVFTAGKGMSVRSPINARPFTIAEAGAVDDCGRRLGARRLPEWRQKPAPKRGELVLLGDELRKASELGRLVP